MTSLRELRCDLAAFIGEQTGITVHPTPRVDVFLPCAVIQPRPDEDYITPTTSFGAETVNLQLVLLAEASGDPSDALDLLDDMIDQIRPVLQFLTSPAGLKYAYGPTSSWGRWTIGGVDVPGVSFNVSAIRAIERP